MSVGPEVEVQAAHRSADDAPATQAPLEVPVAIVGAGPVGLGCALLLARWGIRSAVVEAREGPEAVGSKAICTQRDVLDIFDRIGCAEAMVAEGLTWSVARTYYRERELFSARFAEGGHSRFPPWINLSQSRTEELLWERALAEPLIEVRCGACVVGVAQDAEGVSVRSQTASGAGTVRARYVVACDGARSAVRRLLEVAFDGHSFTEQFLICDIRAELPFPNERRFYFDPEWNPGRQVLVHETPGGVWRIDWQVPDDFDLEAERRSGALDARIRAIVDEREYELVWVSVYRFHERVADRFGVGRVFLAGDAAHLVAPFGARGLNSGMQDVENLAWKLALVLRGVGGQGLLDSYEVERRAAALENLRVTAATMRFLVPRDSAEQAWRRRTLERAVNDAGARDNVDSGKLAEPYWYIHSPLTTVDGATVEGFPCEPGAVRPPVAGVLCPDGPCRVAGRPDVGSLRQLFGLRFVVLAPASRVAEVGKACNADVEAPVEVLALSAIDAEAALGPALNARADSVHVIRPDGHLAAVLEGDDVSGVVAALRRACAILQPAR